MINPLLITKVRIPPKPEHLVHRSRLMDTLEQAIPGHKLIFVSAPAGYGKTTLLAQWAYTSQYKVAWLEVSKEENDPERFFRYLFFAWERVQPEIRETTLGLLLSGMAPDVEAVQTAFVHAAADLLTPVVLVLDDIHTMTEPAIIQSLTFLLDHLPPNIHFILAGRSDLPLPLARYRARRELIELRAEDLRFLAEETADLMNQVMRFALSADEISQLQAQVEGWITGLLLLALSLQRSGHLPDQLRLWGKLRYIADYLKDEVLAYLPVETRGFLLRTSILAELCSSLCAAVSGGAGGQAMLESLERQNLFLLPLDEHREWFRYHRLFAEFLQGELERAHPQDVVHLHRQAARWYLSHDLPDPAIQHAIAGEDAELMVSIAERYFERMLLSGEYRGLKNWLAMLPAQWQSDYPLLGLYQAAILLFTGALSAGAHYVDEVEQRLRLADREDNRWDLARITAVRCTIACFQNNITLAETYAEQAFLDLPAEDHAFRTVIYHSLGDTYRRNGRWEDSRQCYQHVLEMVHAPSYLIRSVHVYGALADLDLQRGRLQAAAEYWRKALTIVEQPDTWGSFPLPLIGWVYIRMAEILYEWDELEQSKGYLMEGLACVQMGGDVRAMLIGRLLACRIDLAQRDVAAAAAHFDQARALLEESSFTDLTSRFEQIQLAYWLAQENRRAVMDWTERMQQRSRAADSPDQEGQYLALARGLLVKGDRASLKLTLELAAHLLQAAEADGRMSVLIEGLLLRSLAGWKLGDPTGAMISLERALRLAEPEGYQRLFIDLGLPLARLLQEARSRGVMAELVNKLLASFQPGSSALARDGEALPEPLSAREREILQQLAAGMTNREIAEKLVISPETVKKHTASIYSKLGVRSRTQTAARARQLDLLE